MDLNEIQSFATGTNATYLEALYRDYLRDPNSVDVSWRYFFAGYDFIGKGGSLGQEAGGDSQEGKVEAFINAYRQLGHLSAYLNPLVEKPKLRDDMTPNSHGLAQVDPQRLFHPVNLGMQKKEATFAEIHDFLLKTYCGTIGADYREVNQIEAVVWFQSQMESCENKPKFSVETKKHILTKLTEAEGFEKFLQDRFLGQKRFSIEGLDAMIVLLDVVADEAAKAGVEEIDIGMAHRGRLNVLANFMGKPYESIIKEFEGTEFNPHAIEGDVKYHKGYANEIDTSSGKKICLYLSPNPSHLEAVNPVLEGFTRSRQRLLKDETRSRVLPVLVHGDAAFVGQGSVAETLNFAELSAYTTGGTIHVVANNQVGFTAYPQETKSCDYASDVAKFIRAPVLHVNADDPEAVVWATMLAVMYRQRYHKDFVIDLIGYRRHGHNETDEPGFTQPLMYKVIKDHPTVCQLYRQQLIQEGVVDATYVDDLTKAVRKTLQDGLDLVRAGKYVAVDKTPATLRACVKYEKPQEGALMEPVKTAVSTDQLKKIGMTITSFPSSFTPHPKISKLFEGRREMLQGDGAIDWGMAELLAYGSCAAEGHHVRLSGQDCGRGTFSHRHAVLRDYQTNAPLEILNLLQAERVDVVNSPLSELGCMGFEFGYSVADPNALVLWEGQFGDFVNGAQIIIDQFLVASEAKWKQTSSLVLLLPHGYEGQGPEHSSARPERFLQSCGNQNIQVANVTTPAQFFHLLRRQVLRKVRKPLVVMTPKSLLRHPKVVSGFEEFSSGGFAEILPDPFIKDVASIRRLVICSGKIYYDLIAERDVHPAESKHVAIVRIEQLYPLASEKLAQHLAGFNQLSDIVWTQEEPQNMGAWSFMRPRLEDISRGKYSIKYVGRPEAGTTAEGSQKSHALEQQRIVKEALT